MNKELKNEYFVVMLLFLFSEFIQLLKQMFLTYPVIRFCNWVLRQAQCLKNEDMEKTEIDKV